MGVAVPPSVPSARVDGGLDSRLRGNDDLLGLRRLRRDFPEGFCQQSSVSFQAVCSAKAISMKGGLKAAGTVCIPLDSESSRGDVRGG